MWMLNDVSIDTTNAIWLIKFTFENEYVDGSRYVDFMFKRQGDSMQDVIRKLLTLIGSLVSIGIGK